MQAPNELVAALAGPRSQGNALCRENALRLVRRWAADGSAVGYDASAAMIDALPDDALTAAAAALRTGLKERGVGLKGIGQGGLFAQLAEEDDAPPIESRQYESIAGELREFIDRYQAARPDDVLALELALRAGIPGSAERLLQLLKRDDVAQDERPAQIALLREIPADDACEQALMFVRADEADDVVLAGLDVLDAQGGTKQISTLLQRYPQLSTSAKARTRDLLFSRPEAARQFLEQVERGDVDANETPIMQLTQLAVHGDAQIDETVRQIWGQIGAGTSEEKLATMRRFNNDLRAGTGDPAAGKLLFTKHCANCHQLHGEGAKVGPDLTTANRQDLAALLGNLVDPSAVVKRDYTAYVVLTDTGRTITGLIADQNAARLTILDAQNRQIEIPNDEIEVVEPSTVSLMPERLLEALTPQELRDLFSYLQK